MAPRTPARTASLGNFFNGLKPRSQTLTYNQASFFLSAPIARSISSAAFRDGKPPPEPPKRWHSDLQARLGKCITFGCSSPQVSRAAAVCRALATEWRGLVAGSEGFLTGGKRGLSDQKVVWGEMDSFGHVNNVVYFRYAESSRVNWVTSFAVHGDPEHAKEWREAMTPKSIGLIMKSLKGDFKLPMVYPDTISVYHKLRHRPSSNPAPTSVFLDCIILSHHHRRIAATMEEDIAIYDYRKARKTEMPEFMQKMLEKTFVEQEEETVRARTRIWELIKEVEKLEKETWDRHDAVEDMGSSPGS